MTDHEVSAAQNTQPVRQRREVSRVIELDIQTERGGDRSRGVSRAGKIAAVHLLEPGAAEQVYELGGPRSAGVRERRVWGVVETLGVSH